MKKLYLFLLAVSLISLACEKEKAPKQECGEVEVSQDEHIKMQVLPEKVSANSPFVLKIENLTKEDVLYDAAFSLEYFNENEWQSIQLGITFEDVGYILKVGKTAEEQLDLPAEKYSLKAGKYRINKTVTVVNHKSYKLCAEFEI